MTILLLQLNLNVDRRTRRKLSTLLIYSSPTTSSQRHGPSSLLSSGGSGHLMMGVAKQTLQHRKP